MGNHVRRQSSKPLDTTCTSVLFCYSISLQSHDSQTRRIVGRRQREIVFQCSSPDSSEEANKHSSKRGSKTNKQPIKVGNLSNFGSVQLSSAPSDSQLGRLANKPTYLGGKRAASQSVTHSCFINCDSSEELQDAMRKCTRMYTGTPFRITITIGIDVLARGAYTHGIKLSDTSSE